MFFSGKFEEILIEEVDKPTINTSIFNMRNRYLKSWSLILIELEIVLYGSIFFTRENYFFHSEIITLAIFSSLIITLYNLLYFIAKLIIPDKGNII